MANHPIRTGSPPPGMTSLPCWSGDGGDRRATLRRRGGVPLVVVVAAATAQTFPSRMRTRIQDLLVQAGMAAVTPTALLSISVGTGVVITLAVLAMTGSVSIAVAFGCLAALAPQAYVRMRARKRRVALRELWPDAVDDL